MLQYVTPETLTTILSTVPLRQGLPWTFLLVMSRITEVRWHRPAASAHLPSRRVRLTRRVAYDLT